MPTPNPSLSPSAKRLLKAVRVLSQNCETIAAACRNIEKEITVADTMGQPFDDDRIEQMVKRIEGRALHAFTAIGIRHGNRTR